jgi:hypothetical protein
MLSPTHIIDQGKGKETLMLTFSNPFSCAIRVSMAMQAVQNTLPLQIPPSTSTNLLSFVTAAHNDGRREGIYSMVGEKGSISIISRASKI